MKLKRVALLAVACFAASFVAAPGRADVRLPQIFGDHMVLQREQPIPVWGWADPGENVSVGLGGEAVATVAGDDGRWIVKLPARQAGGPRGIDGQRKELAHADGCARW